MSLRTRIGLAALAGLAGCAALGTAGSGGWLRSDPVQGGVHRAVRVSPARPRVGDTIHMTALLVNRGVEPFAWDEPCYDDGWNGSRLPLPPPPPDTVPPDTSALGRLHVICLGVSHHVLQPGDTAILSERRWGPLTRPGTFSVNMGLYHYWPGAPALDRVTVRVTVRPRR